MPRKKGKTLSQAILEEQVRDILHEFSGDGTVNRPSMRELMEKNNDYLDYIVNRVAVNGDTGLQNILTAHHNSIKSLKDDVGANSQRIGVLMEVTEEERAKYDLKKKWKAYKEASTTTRALIKFFTNKQVLTVIGFIVASALGITGWFKDILGLF